MESVDNYYTHVLAHFPMAEAPHHWSVYTSEEAARKDLARAPKETPWQVMKFDEYIKRCNFWWCSGTIVEVTEKHYYETSGSCTGMYSKIGDRFFCKTVNAADKETWLSEEMVRSRIVVKAEVQEEE